MRLEADEADASDYERIVVAFNATNEVQTLDLPLTDTPFELHPVQQQSGDDRVKEARLSGGTLSVPARTTAVFVSAGDN